MDKVLLLIYIINYYIYICIVIVQPYMHVKSNADKIYRRMKDAIQVKIVIRLTKSFSHLHHMIVNLTKRLCNLPGLIVNLAR